MEHFIREILWDIKTSFDMFYENDDETPLYLRSDEKYIDDLTTLFNNIDNLRFRLQAEESNTGDKRKTTIIRQKLTSILEEFKQQIPCVVASLNEIKINLAV